MSISAFKIFAVSILAAALAACSSSSSPSPAPSPTTPTIKAPSTGSNNTKATTPSEPPVLPSKAIKSTLTPIRLLVLIKQLPTPVMSL